MSKPLMNLYAATEEWDEDPTTAGAMDWAAGRIVELEAALEYATTQIAHAGAKEDPDSFDFAPCSATTHRHMALARACEALGGPGACPMQYAPGRVEKAEAECASVLPDQPPPKPGHGDVMREVIDSMDIEGAMVMTAPGGPLERLCNPRNRYHGALALAAAQARELGVDLRVAFRQRHAKALKDHGTPLQRGNARDHGVDACQEQIDAAVYTRAMWVEEERG